MADTTLSGVLLKGTAAARPAASAVAKGTIYSATDTGAITQSDASSWSTFATISSGLADPMTTRGDIIVRNASNTTARLGIGSSGKVLSSDGTDISWQTPASSGALVLLEQHDASGGVSSLDFTTFISSTYDTYKILGVDLAPATNTADLRLEVGTGGGPTYDTGSNYEWVGNGYRSDGVAHTNFGSTGIAKIFNSMTNTAGYGNGSFDLTLFGPQSTAVRKQFIGVAQFVDSSPANCMNMLGISWVTSGTAMTALRFIMSSGNIASGIIRIYGVAK